MNDYEQKVRGVGMYAPNKSKPYMDKVETFIVTDEMFNEELKIRYDLNIEELEKILEEYAPERLI